MLENTSKELTQVGAAMLRGAPEGWREIRLHVSGAGAMTGTELEIVMADGQSDRSRGLDSDGSIACDQLREAMYKLDVGTWYNATLTIDQSKQVIAEFDYDNPPFKGDATDELLLEDQEDFPRDAEHLPAWHPARSRQLGREPNGPTRSP